MAKNFTKKLKKAINAVVSAVLVIALIISIAALAINARVVFGTKKYILTVSQAKELSSVDCIVILGCSVKADKSLSVLLKDRVDRGIELYTNGVSSKILMSGDHSTKYYDEVNTMKKYAAENGVSENDIITDPAGLSSYESMFHLKNDFNLKKVVIVTQSYHLSRCVYIARALGIDAYGVACDISSYSESTVSFNKNREFFARIKDYFYCAFGYEPPKVTVAE